MEKVWVKLSKIFGNSLFLFPHVILYSYSCVCLFICLDINSFLSSLSSYLIIYLTLFRHLPISFNPSRFIFHLHHHLSLNCFYFFLLGSSSENFSNQNFPSPCISTHNLIYWLEEEKKRNKQRQRKLNFLNKFWNNLNFTMMENKEEDKNKEDKFTGS